MFGSNARRYTTAMSSLRRRLLSAPVMAMRRRVVSLVTRKHEHDADLRYSLFSFCDNSTLTNGARALARLEAYKHTQNFVRDHLRSRRESGIGAFGLRAVFYARYFTTRGLIMEDYATDPQWAGLAKNLADKTPNRLFKQRIDAELATCEVLSEQDAVSRDSYREITVAHLGEPLASRFLACERELFDKIKRSPSSDIRDRFNGLNQDTARYAHALLERDILCLEKAGVRVRTMFDRNRQWLGGVIAVCTITGFVWKLVEPFLPEAPSKK